MKIEQVERGISGIGNWVKNNPLMVLGVIVLVFLVFLFARPERRAQEALPQPKHEPLPIEPPVALQDVGALDIGVLFEDVIVRQEMLAGQVAALHDALRIDRPDQIIAGAVDYRECPQRYIEYIFKEGIIRQPRPRKDDKILIAEGRWEPVDEVIRRQRKRYERALAEGRKEDAKLVRRETELALGHRVVW